MYYKNNDINIYYEVYGRKNKKKILILPGWGDNRKTFTYFIKYLQKDYKIYILDYPGFGYSKFPNKDLTIYDYATIIRDFIKENNIDNPIILAHSFGGRISIILSGIYKIKIDRLILIDIAGIKRKSIMRYLKQTIYKLRKKLVIFIPKRNKIKYLTTLRKKYSSTDYNNLEKNMYNTFKNIVNKNLKKYIKNIKTKTIIIWGSKDNQTPLKDGYYINKKIKNSHLYIFPKGTHFPYLEYKNPILNIIINFLSQ